MLRSTNYLTNHTVRATDGDIGEVKDFFFDDQKWVVRYLVVETGNWLSSRKVLVSPVAVQAPEWAEKILRVSITREQVKNSPDIDTDRPVSRQQERMHTGHYGYPYYWGGAGLWGAGLYPGMMLPGIDRDAGRGADPLQGAGAAAHDEAAHETDDPHLRSCKVVTGYHIHATDGDIGHVEGLLVEDSTWAVRYLIVNTSNWWTGHQVLIAPQWIRDVSWDEASVSVDMTRQAVKDAPLYDARVVLERTQEEQIYAHHRRTGYWADETERGTKGS